MWRSGNASATAMGGSRFDACQQPSPSINKFNEMKYMGPVTDSSTSWYWLRNGCDWIHRHTPGRITSIFDHLFPLPLYVAFNFLVCHPPPGTHPKAITMVMSLPQGHHQNDGLRVCPGGRYYTKKLNAT